MEISYRKPHFEDLGRLAEIYNHAVRETAATFDTEEKAPDYFRCFVPGDHLHRMLVAEVNGEVVVTPGLTHFPKGRHTLSWQN